MKTTSYLKNWGSSINDIMPYEQDNYVCPDINHPKVVGSWFIFVFGKESSLDMKIQICIKSIVCILKKSRLSMTYLLMSSIYIILNSLMTEIIQKKNWQKLMMLSLWIKLTLSTLGLHLLCYEIISVNKWKMMVLKSQKNRVMILKTESKIWLTLMILRVIYQSFKMSSKKWVLPS